MTEAGQPYNVRVATEPGPLAFGILACLELRGCDRLIEREQAAHHRQRLFIAQRLEWLLGAGRSAREESADFFDQTGTKHPRCSRVQAFV